MWLTDAYFKWSPTFQNSFLGQIQSAGQGQPAWMAQWFNLLINLISHNPHFFVVLTAFIETLIALTVILGLARRTSYLSAAIFSLLIWGVAEGFGGPYTSASTDIGTAIIYAVVFFALYGLERLASPPTWSLDNYIVKKIPWWSIVANP